MKPSQSNAPVSAPVRALFYLTKEVKDDHLGRVPITFDKNGHQTVLMSREEAQYWVDQGAISPLAPPQRQQRIDERKASVATDAVPVADPAPDDDVANGEETPSIRSRRRR